MKTYPTVQNALKVLISLNYKQMKVILTHYLEWHAGAMASSRLAIVVDCTMLQCVGSLLSLPPTTQTHHTRLIGNYELPQGVSGN